MKKNLLLLIIITAAIVSCKKNTVKPVTSNYLIDQKTVTLHYNESHQFKVNLNQDSVPASAITWTASDTTVGTVNDHGLFRAKKIGADTITAVSAQFKLTSVITVTPYYQLFREPYFVLGADTNAVKMYETRKFAGSSESNTAGEEQLLFNYYGENSNVTLVTYLFVDGKLSGATLFLTGNNDFSFTQKLMTFYAERYPVNFIARASFEVFTGPYYASSYQTITVDADILDNITITY